MVASAFFFLANSESTRLPTCHPVGLSQIFFFCRINTKWKNVSPFPGIFLCKEWCVSDKHWCQISLHLHARVSRRRQRSSFCPAHQLRHTWVEITGTPSFVSVFHEHGFSVYHVSAFSVLVFVSQFWRACNLQDEVAVSKNPRINHTIVILKFTVDLQ